MRPVLSMLLLALNVAPFQCASKPRPEYRHEDTAPEALWALAQRFHNEGDEPARRTTLTQIVELYPSSRYSERAKMILGGQEPSDINAP